MTSLCAFTARVDVEDVVRECNDMQDMQNKENQGQIEETPTLATEGGERGGHEVEYMGSSEVICAEADFVRNEAFRFDRRLCQMLLATSAPAPSTFVHRAVSTCITHVLLYHHK